MPVRLWFGQRPRFYVHYTPTYSSWLNQVERWFGLITQRAIRRASLRSVRDLIARIQHFLDHYNRNCRPFTWTATADSIFQKPAQTMLSYFRDSTLGAFAPYNSKSYSCWLPSRGLLV
jgi:hypothetical protein